MKQYAYQLTLGDSHEWQIMADKDSELICERLAHMAKLKATPANSHKTIIFIRNSQRRGLKYCLQAAASLDGVEKLPERGWTCTRLRYAELWSHPDVPYIINSVTSWGDHILETVQMQQSLYPVVSGAIFAGGLPMHAALVERRGRGVIIAARGNTGKSTCCKRIPQPWRAVSDDEALILMGGKNDYIVHPFPTWSQYMMTGTSDTWDVQERLELAGIFFLEQHDKDEVIPLRRGKAAMGIYNSGVEANLKYELELIPDKLKMLRGKMLENACRIANTVPAYALRASLTGHFWTEIEKALSIT